MAGKYGSPTYLPSFALAVAFSVLPARRVHPIFLSSPEPRLRRSQSPHHRLAAAALVLHQREAGIHRAADSRCAGDAAEHIVGKLLPQMVDQQNGDAVGVRDVLQCGEITVVVGV